MGRQHLRSIILDQFMPLVIIIICNILCQLCVINVNVGVIVTCEFIYQVAHSHKLKLSCE